MRFRSGRGRSQLLCVLSDARQEQFAERYRSFADPLVGLLKEERKDNRPIWALAMTMRRHTASSA
jgi:hypothetical protein